MLSAGNITPPGMSVPIAIGDSYHRSKSFMSMLVVVTNVVPP
ncbi:hypothetical protein VAS14_16327 [Vibrio angustum S14]|uniref:Uncharacterized protein n=1 Tax=Photobacterium angustum (strain S14 / CCUG 15956) TaxID=314292 RepID=Q1ZM75_PHOAS|nr:hypothetical protein VAS14_16327 [Vibrio angustum S14] [Photobacterium angustum S14]